MIQFTTTIKRFDTQGEKTGWTYIDVPGDLAQQLVPENRKGFRVKGLLDKYRFEGLSLIPMGGGNFILPLNATIRKAIHKKQGAMLDVKLDVDPKPILPPPELMECLSDEPKALANFNKLPKSHQNYYTKWINEAKTEVTKTKRIAQTVTALSRGMDFGEAMRSMKKEK
jgi:hypothetical protein